MSNINRKIFYIHIPKTAGSSTNSFLTSQFNKESSLVHIESTINFKNKQNIKDYIYISGHIPYPEADRHLNIFNDYTTFTLFRFPLHHVISHLAWVRKLGDKQEAERLKKHTPQIQKIVKRIVTVDFTSDISLNKFIKWLEKENIYLFHDTQTRYLCGSPREKINPFFLNIAMKNIEKINYIGITERHEEFLLMLSYQFNFSLLPKKNISLNTNEHKYGLDINNLKVQKVLKQLILNDEIIYRIARENFSKTWHTTLVDIEKTSWAGYSTVSTIKVTNQLARLINV